MSKFYYAFALIVVSSFISLAKAADSRPNQISEWLSVCEEMKAETSALLVFSIEATEPSPFPKKFDVDYLDINGLLVPYPASEEFVISSRTNSIFPFSLRLEFEDGLRITVFREEYSAIGSVFDTFFPNLSSSTVSFLKREYVSSDPQLESLYAAGISRQAARFKGYEYTVEDIACKENSVAEDLMIWPALLSSASGDFQAISEGNDIALYSRNKYDGVVTRQVPVFGSESTPPEVFWSGEFLDKEWFYTVSIVYPEELDDLYDALGAYLAAPGLYGSQ